MNSLQIAREKMKLTEEEFALLLGWPCETVSELENEPEFALGTFRPLSTLLTKLSQAGQVLLEERMAALSADSPDREALCRLARKIYGGH